MASDYTPTRARGMSDPATRLAPVTPADADLPGGLTRGLYAGGAGVLAVIDAEGGRADLATPAGAYHPIRVRRVLAATTASGVVALY